LRFAARAAPISCAPLFRSQPAGDFSPQALPVERPHSLAGKLLQIQAAFSFVGASLLAIFSPQALPVDRPHSLAGKRLQIQAAFAFVGASLLAIF
jgi:hypothetical protein